MFSRKTINCPSSLYGGLQKKHKMLEYLTYISLRTVCHLQYVNYKHADWAQSDILKEDYNIKILKDLSSRR
jgi:hypothetical protein